MAREWQPEVRSEQTQTVRRPSDEASAGDGRHRHEPPSGSTPDPVTGSVALSDTGLAKGPGGTTGWFPEQDFRRRSRGPIEQRTDPEAETRHQPAVGTQEEVPDPGPAPEDLKPGSSHPDNEERYADASATNTADDASEGEAAKTGTDPGGGPRELHGQEEDLAAPPPDASRWQRLVGRTTGGGPLSAGRMARERAQQTPPGGKGPQDPALAKDPRPRQDPDLEPGGTMDPSLRMRRIAEQINRGDRDPHTAEKYDDEEEEEAAREGLARGGPLVWLIDHWKAIAIPIGVLCMFAFVVATVGLPDFGGGEDVASSRGGAGESPAGNGGASGPEGSRSAPLYDSGLSFSYSQREDGTVELSAGEDITWTGRIERVSKEEAPQGGATDGEDGARGDSEGSAAQAAVEVLRLSGPTAAEVGPGYTMDSASENPGQTSTTVFAVEGDGVPDVHATFHLFSGSSGAGVARRSNGTYDVTADSGELIAEGTYSDHRSGASGGREVIRTYTEQLPGESGSRQFRVRYEADQGIPIPLLAGWQTPDERPEDLKLKGAT